MKKKWILSCIIAVVFVVGGYEMIQRQIDLQNNLPVSSGGEFETTAVLQHDSNSFTEGLLFYQGCLYESSGLYEKPYVFAKESPESKEILFQKSMPAEIFAKGIAVLKNEMYLLTYRENKAFRLNPDNFSVVSEFSYEGHGEGWGMTTDGTYLIADNGTDEIFFMDGSLQTVRKISVTEKGSTVNNLNELEWIDGFLYANIWQTNDIAVIDADSGNVLKRIDCTAFAEDMLKRNEIKDMFQKHQYDVMNGIAYDGEYLYLTGKFWRNMYQCRISDDFKSELIQLKGAEE